MEFGINVDIGLYDRHPHRPFVGLPVGRIEEAGDDHRDEQHDGRGDPPAGAARRPQRFEEEDVRGEHPERTAEYARVFVPLHQPHVVRESVAQNEPRPRELADGVPVFGGDPCRDEQDVGEGLGGFFRDRVEEHEGDHVQRRRGERRGEWPDRRGIPDPPDGHRIPEREGEQRPAEDAPPRAARGVVRGADPQQGYERREETQTRRAEPPRREQESRQEDRCESEYHGVRDFTAAKVVKPAHISKIIPNISLRAGGLSSIYPAEAGGSPFAGFAAPGKRGRFVGSKTCGRCRAPRRTARRGACAPEQRSETVRSENRRVQEAPPPKPLRSEGVGNRIFGNRASKIRTVFPAYAFFSYL